MKSVTTSTLTNALSTLGPLYTLRFLLALTGKMTTPAVFWRSDDGQEKDIVLPDAQIVAAYV
ncbi:hypothetical protein KDW_48040 [Dictyobacter vulcani]|uniref:Uncharacterized protein n=1 Tax=Dictyobacter vulcani TaxID=2607529 RepID=A0A5J4KTY6_9CHLR|nr:hypothetical protein [Dictyobacter vulcani]GER90642.1 hypothetical protein KDW_48040 [Dictyobacter vulcani]